MDSRVLLRELFEEYSEWYFSLAEEEGILPRSFSGVSEEGKQFIYLIDGVTLQPMARNKYIRFVLDEHHSVAYAYGGLAMRGDSDFGEIEEILDLVAADATHYIMGNWRVMRDENGMVTGLVSMGIREGDDPEKYPASWYLAGVPRFSDMERKKYEALWESAKGEIMISDRYAAG